MNNHITKTKRDQQIINLLKKFKVCSRNQIAHLIFRNNTNPINVANRVLKRMVRDGMISKIIREKDQTYCYTLNPKSHINHNLKIVDFYIEQKQPKNFVIEPKFGKYEPDIFFQNLAGNTFCVEIQLTPISTKKMQEKINDFVSSYGKEHNAKTLILCTEEKYDKIKIPNGFKIIKQSVPKEILI